MNLKEKHWYQRSRILIYKLFGEDAPLFIDILAATSPRKRIKENWRCAVRIYHSYKRGKVNWYGIMETQKANVQRALDREPLSGDKVFAFSENLKGDLTAVTVDTWICKAYNIKNLTPKRRRFITNDIKDKARELGMFPAEYQAILWCDIIRKAGIKPVSYEDVVDKQLYLWEN